jgi:hypothetical protein
MSLNFSLLVNILSLLLLLIIPSFGFELTFPTDSHYWVACGWNNITWRSTSPPDPSQITLMLTNPNRTLINTDLAIGNAVQGSLNAAMVYIPCITAADGYQVLFVPAGWDNKRKFQPSLLGIRNINADILSVNTTESKVLYTSPQFSIKPKGTAPDPASGQTSIPSLFQPALQTPGIVIPPPDRLNQLSQPVNTSTTSNNANNDALPKLDASAANFGSFHGNNGARAREVLNDVLFLTVIAAFTALVVTT